MSRPYSESYWLRGFTHGREGKHEELPTNDGPFCPANRGYMKGYRVGWAKLVRETVEVPASSVRTKESA